MNKESLPLQIMNKYVVSAICAASFAIFVYFLTKVVFLKDEDFVLLMISGVFLIIGCLVKNEFPLYALLILAPYPGILCSNVLGVRGLDAFNIAYLVSFFYMFMVLIKNPEKRYLNQGLVFLIVLFLSVEFISWVRYFYINEYNEASLKNWTIYFLRQVQIVSLYFVFAICIQRKNTARNLIYFVVGFALVANMIHIGNFMIGLLSHKFLGETHTHITLLAKRAEEMSLLRNNNPILGITLKDHASLVLQIIPFSIMLYYTSLNNKITKLFALIVTTSSIVCILLSQHRTAYVGLLVGILYLALFVEKRLRKYLVAGFVISIVIVSIGTVYFGRFSDPQMYESVNTFSGGRVYVWGRVIQFLVDNPLVFLIGGGKACFINEGSSYLTLIGYPLDPHSAYLGELISKGIIGLLIFIYFLYYTLKSQIMFMKSNSDTFFHMVSVSIVFNLIAACVVHIFGGIGFPGTDHVHAYIWLFLGVTSMASRNRNNNDSCSRISQAELKN